MGIQLNKIHNISWEEGFEKIQNGTVDLIITSPHPSPFSARTGFFGSKPFSKTNNFLRQHNLKEIDWQIE